MNQIEAEARPFLTPIVAGAATSIDSYGLTAVAKWIALKVIVAEHAVPDNALAPLIDRAIFHQSGKIPDYFRLYVAHNISKQKQFYIRHAHCFIYAEGGPNPPLEGTTQNVQVVTFVAGEAIIQAVCTRIAGVSLEDKAHVVGFHDRCRIFPTDSAVIDFPQRPRLDFAGINSVSGIMDRYIAASRGIWI
jgi:hypothetical protein